MSYFGNGRDALKLPRHPMRDNRIIQEPIAGYAIKEGGEKNHDKEHYYHGKCYHEKG